ncbi:MAG: hypothetical protein ACI9F9_001993, partial [Candidatus Paceibacteria bacterium]
FPECVLSIRGSSDRGSGKAKGGEEGDETEVASHTGHEKMFLWRGSRAI